MPILSVFSSGAQALANGSAATISARQKIPAIISIFLCFMLYPP
jgi:hypothetical protein